MNSNEFAVEILQKVGIDANSVNIIGFDLKFRVDTVPELILYKYLWDKDFEKIKQVIEKYTLSIERKVSKQRSFGNVHFSLAGELMENKK